MLLPSDIEALARQVIETYAAEEKKLVTAESCTGGLISAALTSVSGSSAVFERGFVTYSNDAKTDLLGVLPDTLSRFGAVSHQTAEAMAFGALEYSLADIAVSVTGIAGPTGGLPAKPVGTVYFGVARKDGVCFHMHHVFQGGRDAVRHQATMEALKLFLSLREAG